MREILAYLALKYKGDYTLIKNAIFQKEPIPKNFMDDVKTIKSNYITIVDQNYPKAFINYSTPPFVLFYYGDINLINNPNIVAMIGTRKNSEYGEEITIKLVKEMKKYNPVIISGMAKGIDSIAQTTAMEKGLKSIGVLGCGIDRCYPESSRKLYESLKKHGLIISEYPNDTEAQPSHFLIRNRIIAALCSNLIVCEAAIRSGTMNTVSYALTMGKEIYCVPYPATIESGCNLLIKQGAILITHGKDLYE